MITIEDPELLWKICGSHGRKPKELERLLNLKIYKRGNEIHSDGANPGQIYLFQNIIHDLENTSLKDQNLTVCTLGEGLRYVITGNVVRHPLFKNTLEAYEQEYSR